jgi:hypothetical protein
MVTAPVAEHGPVDGADFQPPLLIVAAEAVAAADVDEEAAGLDARIQAELGRLDRQRLVERPFSRYSDQTWEMLMPTASRPNNG